MANVVGNLVVKLSALTADFDSNMKKASATAQREGGRITNAFNRTSNSNAGAGLSKFASMIGMKSVTVAGALALWAKGFKDFGEQMKVAVQESEKLGMLPSYYLNIQKAASKAGVDAGVFTGAIQKMRLEVAEAIKTGKAGVFGELGLDPKKLASSHTASMLQQISRAIMEQKDPLTRLRLEYELFGKAGKDVDQALKEIANNFGGKNVIPDAGAIGGAELWKGIKSPLDVAKEAAKDSYSAIGKAYLNLIDVYNHNPLETRASELINQRIRAINEATKAAALAAHAAEQNRLNEAYKYGNDIIVKMGENLRALQDPRGAAIMSFFNDMKSKGIGGEKLGKLIEEFKKAYDAMEAFKREKEEVAKWEQEKESIKQYGEQLRRSLETPLEAYERRLKEIDKWRKDSTLAGLDRVESNRLADRAMIDARKDAADALARQNPAMKAPDIIPSLIQGTREAYEAILKNNSNPQVQEAKKTNQKLDEIKKKLDFAEARL